VKWDVKFIERFMLVFGPVSSVFDFITFYVLLYLFGAGEALFQTGWFIESITTQVLVVFAIRTRRPIFRSKPHVFLAAMAIAVVAVAIALPDASRRPVAWLRGAAAAVLRFFDRRDVGLSCHRGNSQTHFLPRHVGCKTLDPEEGATDMQVIGLWRTFTEKLTSIITMEMYTRTSKAHSLRMECLFC
jgi:hypothetical protein